MKTKICAIYSSMKKFNLLTLLIRESLADIDNLDITSRQRFIDLLITKGFYLKPTFWKALEFPHRNSNVNAKDRKKAIEELGGRYVYSNQKKRFFWVFEDSQGIESAKKYLKPLIAADNDLSRRDTEAERAMPGYLDARQADDYFRRIERGDTVYDIPNRRKM